jgi:hypothetical protein
MYGSGLDYWLRKIVSIFTEVTLFFFLESSCEILHSSSDDRQKYNQNNISAGTYAPCSSSYFL